MQFAAPIEIDTGETVRREWIDYNDHMNVAYYLLAFDRALDRLYDSIGLGIGYRTETNCSTMTLESHLNYRREVVADDALRFTFQLLDYDAKRQHFFGAMYQARDGFLAATHEWLTIHVDLTTRRSAPMPPEKTAILSRMMAAHRDLPRPELAGRAIGIRRT